MVGNLLRRLVVAVAVLFLLGAGDPAAAQTIKVVGWNVESGDSDAQTLAQRVRDFQGVDVWGFSEVQNAATATTLRTAAAHNENANFRRVLGTTGGEDRLLIVYNNSRLEKLDDFELEEINIEDRVRAPLVAEFRVRATGRRFLFMVNHLYRGSAEGRHEQSRLLNQWGREQELPVIAVGDYNYDWNVNNGDNNHDDGFDFITEDSVFRWVRPPTLVRSQCSFNSVLDFVFTTGVAQSWVSSSEIVARNTDCPDNASSSDHRPVQATFTIPQADGPSPMTESAAQPAPADAAPTNRQILERIEAIEAEMRRLRDLLRPYTRNDERGTMNYE
jgi:endonuclease/exonuclease/phosphatase family metal-dependent hydrolase